MGELNDVDGWATEYLSFCCGSPFVVQRGERHPEVHRIDLLLGLADDSDHNHSWGECPLGLARAKQSVPARSKEWILLLKAVRPAPARSLMAAYTTDHASRWTELIARLAWMNGPTSCGLTVSRIDHG